MALNTCKMEMSGVIQSGTHELAHFVLALTHGVGGAMVSCFYVGICLVFMPLASCVQSNTLPLGGAMTPDPGLEPTTS